MGTLWQPIAIGTTTHLLSAGPVKLSLLGWRHAAVGKCLPVKLFIAVKAAAGATSKHMGRCALGAREHMVKGHVARLAQGPSPFKADALRGALVISDFTKGRSARASHTTYEGFS